MCFCKIVSMAPHATDKNPKIQVYNYIISLHVGHKNGVFLK